ncbi:MAG: hypothetical protein M1308_19735 [Actinobacteria bacterium]|nr:hypothetical protein [Actinomycetota bacterium]
MDNNIKEKTVKKRIAEDKKLVIELLYKTPIVSVVTEKTGIGRSTYYRWRKTDKKFESEADAAIVQGTLLVNDIAESQLLSSIKNGNLTAVIFWLKHHHASYETRIELRGALGKTDEKLSKRQEEIIREALKITSINETPELKGDSDDKEENN